MSITSDWLFLVLIVLAYFQRFWGLSIIIWTVYVLLLRGLRRLLRRLLCKRNQGMKDNFCLPRAARLDQRFSRLKTLNWLLSTQQECERLLLTWKSASCLSPLFLTLALYQLETFQLMLWTAGRYSYILYFGRFLWPIDMCYTQSGSIEGMEMRKSSPITLIWKVSNLQSSAWSATLLVEFSRLLIQNFHL